MREDILVMSQKEIKRLSTIQKVLGKEINQQEAAELLRISDRQVSRVVKRIREEGEKGIAHRMRGREGVKTLKEANQALRYYLPKFKLTGTR